MERDKGEIFTRATDCKPLFLLKIKVKQNLDCPNKEYNSFFEHLHHILRANSRKESSLKELWNFSHSFFICTLNFLLEIIRR